MTLAATKSIDLVAIPQDRTTLELILVATEDLSETGASIELLRSKLATYEDAVAHGILNESYPEFSSFDKLIRLEHYTPLGRQAEEVMENAGRRLSRGGVRLVSRRASYNPLSLLFALWGKEKIRDWPA